MKNKTKLIKEFEEYLTLRKFSVFLLFLVVLFAFFNYIFFALVLLLLLSMSVLLQEKYKERFWEK